MSAPASSTSETLARRQRVLAPTYRLFYEEPVHVVRGEGVWLYDAEGRRYLDCYNNVPVVGHCHPAVIERLAGQAAKLNTHTRYLTDTPIELAERLLATLPRELTSVTFTCTGSESNDLAVRISKAATGRTGFIVTESAYHGTTETLSRMSPVTGVATAAEVFTVPAPVGPQSAADFAQRVHECIERMRQAGVLPAALLVDTIFGSDGVASHPAGFLAAAVAEIHAAGGLFIADEVQPGFGRTGDAMWGFQRHGVIPDLVTMGKPMGNGHPVAALVARPEVMGEFARQHRYFNTFGGNTVSCAVALAVLDVLEREKLIENARDTGRYLQEGLVALAGRRPERSVGNPEKRQGRDAGRPERSVGNPEKHQGRDAGRPERSVGNPEKHQGCDAGRPERSVGNPEKHQGCDAGQPAIGEVRGAGLFVGVQTQSRELAARMVNGLRQEGVLIGAAGRNADVLKIRPPLSFSRANADLFLEIFAAVLRRL